MIPDDGIIARQKRHLARASTHHPKLKVVQFGNMTWNFMSNNKWEAKRDTYTLNRYGFRSWLCSSPYCVYYEEFDESDEDEG